MAQRTSVVVAAIALATSVSAAEPSPRAIGAFDVTFYYVAGEVDHAAPRAGETLLASAIVGERVTLYGESCRPIADVTREFSRRLALQGTGQLADGRVLNVWGTCHCATTPCYQVTSTTWGTGGGGRPLVPFRSVAVDPGVVPLGTALYIPMLDGKLMPGRAPWGGFVHDGCVVAADVGGNVRGAQLDLFTGRRGWYLGLAGRAGRQRGIAVYPGGERCARPASERRTARSSASS